MAALVDLRELQGGSIATTGFDVSNADDGPVPTLGVVLRDGARRLLVCHVVQVINPDETPVQETWAPALAN